MGAFTYRMGISNLLTLKSKNLDYYFQPVLLSLGKRRNAIFYTGIINKLLGCIFLSFNHGKIGNFVLWSYCLYIFFNLPA